MHPLKPAPTAQELDRRVRVAAWVASAALLLRTQSKATFFAKLLRMPGA